MPATHDWYDWICRPQTGSGRRRTARTDENVNHVEGQLKEAERLIDKWRRFDQSIIDRAVIWRDRLCKCIRAKRGHLLLRDRGLQLTQLHIIICQSLIVSSILTLCTSGLRWTVISWTERTNKCVSTAPVQIWFYALYHRHRTSVDFMWSYSV